MKSDLATQFADFLGASFRNLPKRRLSEPSMLQKAQKNKFINFEGLLTFSV
jgi:hypothetical protein